MSPFYEQTNDWKFLQSLAVYDDHNILLGTTDLNGVTWSGLVYYCNDFPLDNSEDKIIAEKTCEISSGVSELVFLNQNRFAVAADDGKLSVYEINTKDKESDIKLVKEDENENAVLSMAYSAACDRLATGGLDSSVKIWDLNNFTPVYICSNAHVYSITGIAILDNSQSISEFVTVSIDGEASFWDIRDSRPAKPLVKLPYELNAVSWNMSNDVAIGTEDGSVIVIDVRKSNAQRESKYLCERGISKLVYSPDGTKLACGSYDSTVKILNPMTLIPSHEDERHTDFVTGLAWCKDDLYSCAWDAKFLKHGFSSPPPQV